MKPTTLWGDVAPWQNKPRNGGTCGRPSCDQPRHVTPGGTLRGYCREHTAEWSKRRRDAAAVRTIR